MLTLEQYNVQLTRLQLDEIELVRSWRNQDFVLKNMEYQVPITAEEQLKWFHTINNASNYYFIIHWQGKKIGIINAKDFNPSLGYGEGGIFIGDLDYLDSTAATFSTLCLLNAVFFEFKISQSSRIKVLNNNTKAIEYNKLLGYKALENTNDGVRTYYELKVADYLKYGAKLNKAAASLTASTTLSISGTPSELNAEAINTYLITQNAR